MATVDLNWWHYARSPEVRRRALKMSAIIGTVLATINYADKLLGGGLSTSDLCKIALTYCVPFCVSTYSAATALAGAAAANAERAHE